MQSPHLWHRVRNFFSAKDPGGLIKRESDTLCAWPSSFPISGKEIPASIPASTARLPISGFLFKCGDDHLNLKESAFSGHESKQLKHITHSVLSHSLPGIGEAAPWQLFVHALQPVHFSLSLTSVRMESLENIPSSAPKGHTKRHQKRGRILLRNRIAKKMSPINQAVLKTS